MADQTSKAVRSHAVGGPEVFKKKLPLSRCKGVELLAQAANTGGTIFEFGALAPELTSFPLFKALSKGPSVRGYTLSEVLFDPKLKLEAEKYVFDHLEAGKFNPRIGRVFPFVQIVEEPRYIESNEQIGKIVVTV